MGLILRFFLAIFVVLNWWFSKIPCRYSFFALAGYNLLIYFVFGRWSIEAVQETLGRDSYRMTLFHIFISLPMFISFICCWSDAKMTSSKFRKNSSSALDNAIEYRNGQVSNRTAQDAFKIMKETAILDQMKANSGNESFDKAVQGFNALHGNSTPQKVYKELTSKD
jgi:hypothetical protein